MRAVSEVVSNLLLVGLAVACAIVVSAVLSGVVGSMIAQHGYLAIVGWEVETLENATFVELHLVASGGAELSRAVRAWIDEIEVPAQCLDCGTLGRLSGSDAAYATVVIAAPARPGSVVRVELGYTQGGASKVASAVVKV